MDKLKKVQFSAKHFVGFILVLTLIVATMSISYEIKSIKRQYQLLAVKMAGSYFQAMVNLRSWNAQHGGIYLPITEDVQPNPYLKDPLRDIVSLEGTELTKVNPAYMTRLLGEFAKEHSDIQYHITSLKPLNPDNHPDTWEKTALEYFNSGGNEEWIVVTTDKGQYLRYMKPLLIEKSCLGCHGSQGYKLGDIRGGITIEVPYSPFQEAAFKQTSKILLTYLLMIVVIVVTTVTLGRRTIKTEKDLWRYSKQLEHQSRTDDLTGLLNRRRVMECLDECIAEALKRKKPLSVLMFDLDNFKQVNDRCGHLVGDKVLTKFGLLLNDLAREGDVTGRYGGDEFVMILPDTDLPEAKKIGHRIVTAFISAMSPFNNFHNVYLGISFGAADLDINAENEEKLADIIIHTADKALYAEKLSHKLGDSAN